MMDSNELFDNRMKEKFKNEINAVPESINTEFENISILIRNKEKKKNMKKLNNTKKAGLIAAAILCALAITMQTAFAQQIVNNIIRSLALNNITIFENKDYKWEDKDIPTAAIGKVFDKNGNVIEKITLENKDSMYNANGEIVFDVEPDGTLITEKVQKEYIEKNAKENPINDLIINDISKINGYTCFDIKLPAYLPQGFEFVNAEFFKDDNGKIIDVCCNLNFENKKTKETIYIAQTYISKGSGCETSFNNIEKAKVNGLDAIVGDEGIVWEANGVNYLMYTYNLGKAESVKIAESIK